MKRRDFLLGLASAGPLALVGGAALAQSFADDLIAQLTAMGFSDIEAFTTWLGRVRIVAARADGVREIVLNPRTGEVLRDFWTPASGDGATRIVLDDIVEEEGEGSGSGSDDDDHSGSGGGTDNSSGSGGDDDNSGPGSGSDDPPDEPDEPDEPDDQ